MLVAVHGKEGLFVRLVVEGESGVCEVRHELIIVFCVREKSRGRTYFGFLVLHKGRVLFSFRALASPVTSIPASSAPVERIWLVDKWKWVQAP
jgi:hypothetical protein